MRKKIVVTIIIVLVAIGLIASLAFVFISRNQDYLNTKEQFAKSETNGVLELNNTENENVIEEEGQNKVDELQNETTEQVQIVNSEKLSEIVSMRDIFGNYYEKAKDILNNMTLEEKVGQLFLARYPEEDANEEIVEYNPGGYVLFSRDFKNETKESILEKINQNQSNSKIKMFIGVDEEGGSVVRVSEYPQFRSSKFKSPKELIDEGGIEKIIEDSYEKTNLLKSLGINLNLAPVVDVSTDKNSFIYNRTIGEGAEETSNYAKVIVKKMNEDRILSSLKHFPRIWK